MAGTTLVLIASCVSALTVSPGTEPWGASASGDDGRVRVTISLHRDEVAPGEVAIIRATLTVLQDSPLCFPQTNHQPLAFLFFRTPEGKLVVQPERGINPLSCRKLSASDYRRPMVLAKGRETGVFGGDIPMVDPSPGWLDPRTYEPVQPNLRLEGVYEAWVRYTIPKLDDAPEGAWHGTVETGRIQLKVREIPVAQRRAEPTAEQLAHLKAYIEYLDALLAGMNVEEVRPKVVEMPRWLSLPDRLRWAMEKTENEGFARHVVAVLREHQPKNASQPYPKWWWNVDFLVRCRAWVDDRRDPTWKIVGPYLDEYVMVCMDAMERDFARITPEWSYCRKHVGLLLAYAKLHPESLVRQRLKVLARRHARVPHDAKPNDPKLRYRLTVSWAILFGLGILRDGMPFKEATSILGEPTGRHHDLVYWNYTTGSRLAENGVYGKVIVDRGRETIMFIERQEWYRSRRTAY